MKKIKINKTLKKTLKKKNNKGSKGSKRSIYIFNEKDYNSGDGMLTSVWGPSLWHSLHTISFNYPIHPTREDKKHYKELILNLVHVLPCKYCRENLRKNLKQLPLTERNMKNRYTFSKYVYDLHELVNTMLGKYSGLSYNDVRERYEHFRARCLSASPSTSSSSSSSTSSSSSSHIKKENGCTTPLYGKKSKCIIRIVPHEAKVDTFNIHKQCIKTRRLPKKNTKKNTKKKN